MGKISASLIIILVLGIVGGFLFIKSYLLQPIDQLFQNFPLLVKPPPTQTPQPTPYHDPNHMPDTPEEESNYLPTYDELLDFKQWSDKYGIELRGTSKPVYFWSALDYKVNDQDVDLNQIKGVSRVYYGLKFLPDDILAVMRGKTIYFSTSPGRSTAVDKTPKGLNAGLFMATTTTYAHAAVHEFGHIFEIYAIGGGAGINNKVENFPQFNALLPEYRNLFPSVDSTGFSKIDYSRPIPAGFISHYATTSGTEDFAEHFAYYVMEGPLFRQRMSNDSLLQSKYNFFKNKVFNGREY